MLINAPLDKNGSHKLEQTWNEVHVLIALSELRGTMTLHVRLIKLISI